MTIFHPSYGSISCGGESQYQRQRDAPDRNADVDKHGNKAEAPINSSSRVFGQWEDVQTEERKQQRRMQKKRQQKNGANMHVLFPSTRHELHVFHNLRFGQVIAGK